MMKTTDGDGTRPKPVRLFQPPPQSTHNQPHTHTHTLYGTRPRPVRSKYAFPAPPPLSHPPPLPPNTHTTEPEPSRFDLVRSAPLLPLSLAHHRERERDRQTVRRDTDTRTDRPAGRPAGRQTDSQTHGRTVCVRTARRTRGGDSRGMDANTSAPTHTLHNRPPKQN